MEYIIMDDYDWPSESSREVSFICDHMVKESDFVPVLDEQGNLICHVWKGRQ